MKNNDPQIPSDTERRFRERIDRLVAEIYGRDEGEIAVVTSRHPDDPPPEFIAQVAYPSAHATVLKERLDRLAQLERAFAVLEREVREQGPICLSVAYGGFEARSDYTGMRVEAATLIEAILAADGSSSD